MVTPWMGGSELQNVVDDGKPGFMDGKAPAQVRWHRRTIQPDAILEILVGNGARSWRQRKCST